MWQSEMQCVCVGGDMASWVSIGTDSGDAHWQPLWVSVVRKARRLYIGLRREGIPRHAAC